MGLLDDLKNQADSKRAEAEAEAERKAKAEQFYREKIQPRMVKAYQYFNEFIDHLKVLNHETIVEYPLLPQGKKQAMRQQGYNVVIDSSKNLKQIDFGMECVLNAPVEFELYGKEVVLSHADRITQYAVKHERKDRKGPSMELESAKFILNGPLPLKVSFTADVEAGAVKLSIRNFVEPGFHTYTLKVEQFNDDFLDRLGRFILRQDMNLFGKEEISDDAREKLRARIEIEKRQRAQELIEAEARRKAEEEAEKANTTKEKLKRAVSHAVEENKSRFMGMFDKLKQQTGLTKETEQERAEKLRAALNTNKPQAQPQTQNPSRTPANQVRTQSPAAPAAAKANNPSPSVSGTTGPAVKPAVPAAKTIPTAQRPSSSVATASAKPAASAPASNMQAKRPDATTSSTTPDKPAAAQPVVKPKPKPKAPPPKVYNAPGQNPFLSADEKVIPTAEEQAAAFAAQDANAEKPQRSQTPVAPEKKTTPEATVPPAAKPARPVVAQATSSQKPAMPATRMPQQKKPEPQMTASRPANTNAAQNNNQSPAPIESGKASELSLEPLDMSPTPDKQTAEVRKEPETLPAIEPANDSAVENRISVESEVAAEPVKAQSEADHLPQSMELSLEKPKQEPQSASIQEPVAEVSTLPGNIEDELERDLAKIIEQEQSEKSASSRQPADSDSDTMDFDLASPDALEIDFENNTGAAGGSQFENDTDSDKSKPS